MRDVLYKIFIPFEKISSFRAAPNPFNTSAKKWNVEIKSDEGINAKASKRVPVV